MKITSYPTFIDLCAFIATINADTPVLFATNADYNNAPNEYYAMCDSDALDALAHLTLAFPSLDSLDYSAPNARFNANDFIRYVYSDTQYTPIIKIADTLYAISDFVDHVVPTIIITPCVHSRTPNV